MQKSVKYL